MASWQRSGVGHPVTEQHCSQQPEGHIGDGHMGLGSQVSSWGSQPQDPNLKLCWEGSWLESYLPSSGLQGRAALQRRLQLLCPGLGAKVGSAETRVSLAFPQSQEEAARRGVLSASECSTDGPLVD